MPYVNSDLAQRIAKAKQPALTLTPAQFNALKLTTQRFKQPLNVTAANYRAAIANNPATSTTVNSAAALPVMPVTPAVRPKTSMPPLFPFLLGAVALVAVGIFVMRRRPRVEVLPPLPQVPVPQPALAPVDDSAPLQLPSPAL